MVRKRKLSRLILAVSLVYVVFCILAGALVANYALHPVRHRLSAQDKEQAPAWAKDDDSTLAGASVIASDGTYLQGWELRPENWNGDAVLLLHGLKGNRLEMVNYADIFLLHGYAVLMPDARAHGDSGGDLATFGLIERDDIHAWVDWLAWKEHPHCVYGFGESMGAAQLLQSLDTTQFCAVAAECPFSTFRESAYDRIGQALHTGPWLGRAVFRPMVELAYTYTRFRYGLNMGRVSPEDAVARTHRPVLLIHGEADTNIPIRHSARIAARNKDVVLWRVPNTGHSNAIDSSPGELEARVVEWFSRHRVSLAVPPQ